MINNNDIKSLAHTKWNSFSKLRTNDKLPITSKLALVCSCFASTIQYLHQNLEEKFFMRVKDLKTSPKYWKSPSLLETLTTHGLSLPKEIGKMIRDLCKWKDVNLIEGEVCIDHVHILVENKVGGMQACLQ